MFMKRKRVKKTVSILLAILLLISTMTFNNLSRVSADVSSTGVVQYCLNNSSASQSLLALFDNGTVRLGGANGFGAIKTSELMGDWNTAPAVTPRYIPNPNNKVVGITVGDSIAASLRQDGTVMLCGPSPAFDTPKVSVAGWTNIKFIKAAGGMGIVGLTTTGRVVYAVKSGETNLITAADTLNAALGASEYYTQIDTYYSHIIGLTNTGRVVAGGNNNDGKATIPASWANETIIQVAASFGHSFALTADGRVLVIGKANTNYWNWNNISGWTGVKKIIASGNDIVAMTDTALLAAGQNTKGELNIPGADFDIDEIQLDGLWTCVSVARHKNGIYYSAGTSSITQTVVDATLNNYFYECETLPFSGTPAGVVMADTSAGGGSTVMLNATAIREYIRFTLTDVPAGTYIIKAAMKGSNDSGYYDLSINGTDTGYEYNLSSFTGYQTKDFGVYSFSTGTQTFTFHVSSKGAGGFKGQFDNIQLIKYDPTSTATTTTTTTTTTGTTVPTTTAPPPDIDLPKLITRKETAPIKLIQSKKQLQSIEPGTDVQTVLSYLDGEGTIIAKDQDGNTVTSGTVGTGYTFVLEDNGEALDEVTVIVYGDIVTDGMINVIDLLKLKRHLLKMVTLQGAYLEAGDANKDTSPSDVIDLLVIKRYILKVGNIYNSADFYVSNTGSDSGKGSLSSPFKTITKAANLMTAGDTCYIMSGVYHETVTPKNSGESGSPITFKAYHAEKVILSGLDRVTAPFSTYSGNIYKADVTLNLNEKNQVFADSKMQTLARFPNKGTADVLSTGTTLTADTASGSSLTSSSLSAGSDFIGGGIAVEGAGHEVFYTSTVNGGSGSFVTFETLPKPAVTGSKFYFYNKLNLLDTENEWFYHNGSLYLYAPGGVNPNTLDIEVKAREYVFDVSEKTFISLDGIEIFGSSVKNNNGSKNLTLNKLNLQYFYHSTKSSTGTEYGGLTLYANNSTIKNSTIAYSSEGAITLKGNNCTIMNNYIHNINYGSSDAAAITPVNNNDTLIAYNTIEKTGKSAIKLTAANLRITGNKFKNISVNLCGGYAVGSVNYDGLSRTEVDHNIVGDSSNNGTVTAYSLGKNSMNFIYHHNVAYNVDKTMVVEGPSICNRVYNNTLIGNAFIGSTQSTDWSGSQFYNNIMSPFFYADHAFLGSNLYYLNYKLKFTDPAKGDYSLLSGATSAIDKGITLPVGTADRIGTADIGAFEFGLEKWAAGHEFFKERNIVYSLTPSQSGFTPTYNLPYLESVSVPGANLVTNGSFENALTGWDIVNAAGVSVTSKTPTHGAYALHLGPAACSISQTISTGITSGLTYHLSAKMRAASYENPCEFGIRFLDANDREIYCGSFITADNVYTEKNTFVTAPEGAAKLQVFVSAKGSDSDIYLDNMKVIQFNP
ncbi:MAG: hypothetical protein BGN88_00465 [Clostridiales bacterium 43-6]|nr:MAG: hypothetical protein BGN88_00465 [Clostridiales bacterium 43-6]